MTTASITRRTTAKSTRTASSRAQAKRATPPRSAPARTTGTRAKPWKAAPPPTGAGDGFAASGPTATTGPNGSRPALASYATDIATTSAGELARLKTGTPVEQRLAATITRAREAYGPLMATGARVVASCPEGNGGEPVLTLVPPGFDAAKPFRVQTHYHGWNSTVAEPSAHAAGVTEAVRDSFAHDGQTVFVLPECRNSPTNEKPVWPGHQNVNVQTDWSNVRDVADTTRAALAAAGYGGAEPKERTVSAHSGGGRALGYAMVAHPDGSGLQADRVELYDCMYAASAGALSARSGLMRWFNTPNGKAARNVTYFEGDGGNGEKPDGAFTRALGARYEYHGHYTHNGSVAQNLGKARPLS